MKIKIFKIDEDISEGSFPKYIERYGYKCKRIKINNINFVSKKIGKEIKFEKGIPDFLIWNKDNEYLCEFKSKNDSWRTSQVKWTIENSDLKIALAIVLLEDEENIETNLEIDTDNEDIFRISSILWRIKDIYWKEYAEENKKEVGKEFTEHYDKNGDLYYLGITPYEVSSKWRYFDTITSKDKQKQSELIEAYTQNKLKTSEDIDVILLR